MQPSFAMQSLSGGLCCRLSRCPVDVFLWLWCGLRDAENANIPFLDGTGGRIALLLRVYVALPHGTCNA